MRVPVVIYADFESYIKPIITCEPSSDHSYTKRYQQHVANSFCIYAKPSDDVIEARGELPNNLISYTDVRGVDCNVGELFIKSLEELAVAIYNTYEAEKYDMIFTSDDELDYNNATHCHICNLPLATGDDDDITVRDHCHITGKYRGAAHKSCNLNYKLPRFYPVIMHNLSGYDVHLFIKHLGGTCGASGVKVIPQTDERYITISKEVEVGKDNKGKSIKRELRFIDSFKFMPSSLDSLLDNINSFPNLEKFYQGNQLKLLLEKGVYPYDYVDNVEVFDEDKLPPQEAFYSQLKDCDISDKEYKHACSVWEAFNCKTFRDYHFLYNRADVLQLADIFEGFRDVCMKNYKLDPIWYYTSPGLAWDACLKKTGIVLELFQDIDMIRMIQAGTRGGVSSIMLRRAVANNKYMGDDYDSTKKSIFIEYLDCNNLYGWAQSQPMPTGGFEWMTESELEDWKNIPCFLEIDCEYPRDLHDLHNDYPLAPECLVLNKVPKLVPNLNNKHNYVAHYRAIKFY